jgi:hypothetical protein
MTLSKERCSQLDSILASGESVDVSGACQPKKNGLGDTGDAPLPESVARVGGFNPLPDGLAEDRPRFEIRAPVHCPAMRPSAEIEWSVRSPYAKRWL